MIIHEKCAKKQSFFLKKFKRIEENERRKEENKTMHGNLQSAGIKKKRFIIF